MSNMVNYHAGANGIVPDTVTKIVAGLYIARPPTTSFACINLAANVTVEPQKSIDCTTRS
jgi:hypothetical protein